MRGSSCVTLRGINNPKCDRRTLARRDTAHHLCSVLNGLLGVESTLLAGHALANNTGVLVYEDFGGAGEANSIDRGARKGGQFSGKDGCVKLRKRFGLEHPKGDFAEKFLDSRDFARKPLCTNQFILLRVKVRLKFETIEIRTIRAIVI